MAKMTYKHALPQVAVDEDQQLLSRSCESVDPGVYKTVTFDY